ncbi:MAG: carbonic anhydrase [Pseudomonadota bacterium]|nr:carbonic anhydrase [Pseudomonadota bacterium]
MDPLIEGYRRFRAQAWPADKARYEALSAKGQAPACLVVACSDSRVDPQTVFGAGPGEMFVVRNIGGLVPPYQPDGAYHGTSAALEYGVRILGVSRLIVLGHAQCGGVKAMVEGAPPKARDFIASWMEIARPAMAPVAEGMSKAEVLAHYEDEVVRVSLANCLTFPWIASAVAEGRLELAGFRFGIATGVLYRLEGDRFVAVE